MAKLCIIRTITMIEEVTVDKYNFPSGNEDQGAMTPKEAQAYELDQEFEDKLDHFAEALSQTSFPQYTDGLNHRRTQAKGVFTEAIVVTEE